MENVISPFFIQSLVLLFMLISFSFLHRIVLHFIVFICLFCMRYLWCGAVCYVELN